MMLSEQPSLTCAREASIFDHLRYYGRPLWCSQPRSDFWENATSKLLGGDDFDLEDTNQLFAILSARLALQLVPVHHGESGGLTHALTVNGVDRHMRILHKVTDDSKLYIALPSEPILALAACGIMLENSASPYDESAHVPRVESILKEAHARLFIQKDFGPIQGDYGELFARLLLLLACDADKYTNLMTTASKWEPDELSKPIMLSSWFRQLATFQHVKKRKDQNEQKNIDDNTDQREINKKIKLDNNNNMDVEELNEQIKEMCGSTDAWVNLTHFDVISKPIHHITPEFLWYCWKRGVAIQTVHDQPGIDGIVPVFIGSLDECFGSMPQGKVQDEQATDQAALEAEFAPRHMSYIAWQVKRKTNAEPGSITSDGRLFGPEIWASGWKPKTRQAAATILMELSTELGFGHSKPSQYCRLIPSDKCEGEGRRPPVLHLRGIEAADVYPCLDVLKARDALIKLAQFQPNESMADMNIVSLPLDNQDIGPGKTSVRMDKADYKSSRPTAAQMDVD